MLLRSFFETAAGWGAVVTDGSAVLRVLLPFATPERQDMEKVLKRSVPEALAPGALSEAAAAAIVGYFRGDRNPLSFPLDLSRTTPFTRAVYGVVCNIPYGSVLTYAEVARRAGAAGAARGVGGALARNPVPLIVPCHRVVAADGRLTGFTAPGGIEAKRWLLNVEKVPMDEKGRVRGTENSRNPLVLHSHENVLI
ncbi:MAG TPA: methylated-DNA--[protein]-cysteine S-methyltransferase [Verrucomicrobiae bacterium]|nr:methylated-DNA--[protein]-cysteine S-methyltransferase [Verrucomicrobiae bacterium]